jgi:hypothetical protein
VEGRTPAKKEKKKKITAVFVHLKNNNAVMQDLRFLQRWL